MVDLSEKDIKTFYDEIALKIKDIRKEKNVSQMELAHCIGHKSMSTIGKIEACLENKHYNLEQLYRISLALEVDIKEFF